MLTIGSDTVDILIREVKVWKNRSWHRTTTGYAKDFDAKYNTSISTEGPIPVLMMESKGPRPDWGRGTDLDDWAFNSAGQPQFWVAGLLDAASNGEIPFDDTAKKTIDLIGELDEKCQGDEVKYHRLVRDVRFGRYVS